MKPGVSQKMHAFFRVNNLFYGKNHTISVCISKVQYGHASCASILLFPFSHSNTLGGRLKDPQSEVTSTSQILSCVWPGDAVFTSELWMGMLYAFTELSPCSYFPFLFHSPNWIPQKSNLPCRLMQQTNLILTNRVVLCNIFWYRKWFSW